MITTYRVGYIVGSLSSVSINRRLALALEKLAPEAGLVLHEISIAELPFYSQDYEAPDAEFPGAAAEYRDAVTKADGILIVTPEYNRSIPGVLKNALDWASRPKGRAPLSGKPSYAVGASIGAIGTAVAQQHLRSILSFLASPELAQPEVYLHAKPGLIAEDGTITVEATRDFLLHALMAFRQHIAHTLHDH
ncbi:NADPH-dependent FMN reductase [Streptomyces sp. NPDC056987]|uniref:NADPH-dependent FMN reductase n=1 Tax=Streptomyces sp. NPDC056987 TaxID=3345988 RepID=UPI003640F498